MRPIYGDSQRFALAPCVVFVALTIAAPGATGTTLQGGVTAGPDAPEAPAEPSPQASAMTVERAQIDLHHALAIEIQVERIVPAAEQIWNRSVGTVRRYLAPCAALYQQAHALIPSLDAAFRARDVATANALDAQAARYLQQADQCAAGGSGAGGTPDRGAPYAGPYPGPLPPGPTPPYGPPPTTGSYGGRPLRPPPAAQPQTPNPTWFDTPAYAASPRVRLPQTGDYRTAPGDQGQGTKWNRTVHLDVLGSRARLQTSNGTYTLNYKGDLNGGSLYEVADPPMSPPMKMLFVERSSGAKEYDVYYQTNRGNLSEYWFPGN